MVVVEVLLVVLLAGLRTGKVVAVLLLLLLVLSIGLRVAVVVVFAVDVVVTGFLAGAGRLLDCGLCGFGVVVRNGGVGRDVVVVVVDVVVGVAVVVGALVVVVLLVVLAAGELLLLLLPVGLVYRLVVVSGKRLVGSVVVGVVVSTIWKVTNLLGTVVVSIRCS